VNQSKWWIAKHFFLFVLFFTIVVEPLFHLYSLEKGPKYNKPTKIIVNKQKKKDATNISLVIYSFYIFTLIQIFQSKINIPK
jgi:hypothetical protein